MSVSLDERTTGVSVSLPWKLLATLREMAKAEETTVSQLVRKILEQHLAIPQEACHE